MLTSNQLLIVSLLKTFVCRLSFYGIKKKNNKKSSKEK